MATAPSYTRLGFPTTFRLLTSDTQLGGVLGDYVAKELKFKRFAIVDDRTAYGQGVAEVFLHEQADLGDAGAWHIDHVATAQGR